MYWGIRTDIADYGLGNAWPVPPAAAKRLAETPTRLRKMDPRLQDRLINWGYAVSDAAVRRYWPDGVPAPAGLPYPGSEFG